MNEEMNQDKSPTSTHEISDRKMENWVFARFLWLCNSGELGICDIPGEMDKQTVW